MQANSPHTPVVSTPHEVPPPHPRPITDHDLANAGRGLLDPPIWICALAAAVIGALLVLVSLP
jgi:hypothetical protein